jgi:hypothetical protein
LFDVQAIYGVIAEEGHTLEGIPLVKASTATTSDATKDTPVDSSPDFDAREYVDKRNNLSNKGKKKTK